MSEPEPTLPVDEPTASATELALLGEMLRHQVGIDPNDAATVTDLAAVAIVNGAWRNSPVEDWHAGGRLSDGDMLRINSYSTWQVREVVRGWRAEIGIIEGSGIDTLDTATIEDIDRLAVRIGEWLVNPSRRLPTGATLGELAGDDLSEYAEHVEDTLDEFATMAEDFGTRHALWRAAAHAGLACRHWWGTPTWPAMVDRFLHALDDPDDPHWGNDPASFRTRIASAPTQVTNRAQLRRLLLHEPWELESSAAQWITDAGTAFLRPTLPPLRQIQ